LGITVECRIRLVETLSCWDQETSEIGCKRRATTKKRNVLSHSQNFLKRRGGGKRFTEEKQLKNAGSYKKGSKSTHGATNGRLAGRHTSGGSMKW